MIIALKLQAFGCVAIDLLVISIVTFVTATYLTGGNSGHSSVFMCMVVLSSRKVCLIAIQRSSLLWII